MRALLLMLIVTTAAACVEVEAVEVDESTGPDAGVEAMPEGHPAIEGWPALPDVSRRAPVLVSAIQLGRSCSTCHLTSGTISKGD